MKFNFLDIWRIFTHFQVTQTSCFSFYEVSDDDDDDYGDDDDDYDDDYDDDNNNNNNNNKSITYMFSFNS
jgi:hypothetical protein